MIQTTEQRVIKVLNRSEYQTKDTSKRFEGCSEKLSDIFQFNSLKV